MKNCNGHPSFINPGFLSYNITLYVLYSGDGDL